MSPSQVNQNVAQRCPQKQQIQGNSKTFTVSADAVPTISISLQMTLLPPDLFIKDL